MKLGLATTEKLLAALGNPEKNFLKIQIAGTNGKGSTCAFLDAICLSANIKTGLFTSPHLISITERIKINGRDVSQKDFARHSSIVREISEKLVEESEIDSVPTFFEQITAIAVSAFAEARIELAILETGLGGRYDSVTATRAEIAALTPIDFDHQEFLGNTLAKIAAEKAAIIRADTTVVSAKQPEQAAAVIKARCEEKNITPIWSDCRMLIEESARISFKTVHNSYSTVKLSLAGEHQRENACVAVNLAEILTELFKFPISETQIIEGLESAKHEGRLEWRNESEPKILFDGAHNVAGAKALRKYLQKYYADSKITFIFGAMRDKDVTEIAGILFPLADNLILTEPDNPRSLAVEELQKIAENIVGRSRIFSIKNVSDAIDSARQITVNYTATKRSFICITGSLYLVGEAKKAILNKQP